MKMTTKTFVIWTLALALPALAHAQRPGDDPLPPTDRDREPASEERRLQVDLRLQGLFFDNFFQAPEGFSQDDVSAWAAELRLAAPLGEELEGYGQLSFVTYEDPLEESPGVKLGLRSDARPHGFDLFVEYLDQRPTGDVGFLVEQADIGRAAGEYVFRPTRDWQLTGLAGYEQQDFAISQGKDNTFLEAGGAVRYRGFGSGFSPEVGATFGERDADDPAEDHDQQDLFVKIRSAPSPRAYLTLRYRHRTRDYVVGDRLDRNFGREDTRAQWVATADLRTGEVLTWNLYYSYEDAESTLASREFTTSLLAAGVTIGLSELFGW